MTKGTTPTTIGGQFVESGISFVKVESIADDGRLIPEKFAQIDEASNQLLARSALEVNDVLFTIAGTIGRVALVPREILPANTNQAVAIVRPNKEQIEPRFLYYCLRDERRIRHARTRVVQSVQANFSLGELSNLEIPLPSREEQRAIAHILGTLDDKIELNRRMNETLEAMARAIFKSWFVDFDPVRAKMEGRQPPGLSPELAALFPDSFEDSELGEIPKGWAIHALDQIADYVNGAACQKYAAEPGAPSLPVIKIRELNQGISEKTDRARRDIPDKHLAHDGDVLFSWSGTLACKLWTGGEGFVNQHVFKVSSAEFPRWFYLYATRHHLEIFQGIAADKATTMGHIKREHLSDAKTLVPGGKLLLAMTNIVEPLIARMVVNDLESRTLSEARDLLLPQLLSGEISAEPLCAEDEESQ